MSFPCDERVDEGLDVYDQGPFVILPDLLKVAAFDISWNFSLVSTFQHVLFEVEAARKTFLFIEWLGVSALKTAQDVVFIVSLEGVEVTFTAVIIMLLNPISVIQLAEVVPHVLIILLNNCIPVFIDYFHFCVRLNGKQLIFARTFIIA